MATRVTRHHVPSTNTEQSACRQHYTTRVVLSTSLSVVRTRVRSLQKHYRKRTSVLQYTNYWSGGVKIDVAEIDDRLKRHHTSGIGYHRLVRFSHTSAVGWRTMARPCPFQWRQLTAFVCYVGKSLRESGHSFNF